MLIEYFLVRVAANIQAQDSLIFYTPLLLFIPAA